MPCLLRMARADATIVRQGSNERIALARAPGMGNYSMWALVGLTAFSVSWDRAAMPLLAWRQRSVPATLQLLE